MIKGMMTVGNSKKVEVYNVVMALGHNGQIRGFERGSLGALKPDVPAINACYLNVGNNVLNVAVPRPINFSKLTISFSLQKFIANRDDFYGDTFLGDCNSDLVMDFMESSSCNVEFKFEYD